MFFRSTGSDETRVSFREAMLRGLAPDGGLFYPMHCPDLTAGIDSYDGEETLPGIALEILRHFVVPEISTDQLGQVVHEALDFPVPLVEVEPGIFALELFHGPTLAFKDVGARCFGRMLPGFLGDSREITVLTATSGDTGGAVANGLYGIAGVRAVVLYPEGKVSGLQERQFATLGGNVLAVAVEGTFDDCQRLVKQAFSDPELQSSRQITTANSINIARWLPQVTYYFWMYRQLGGPAVVSVPSGNMGNITAGLLASAMGMPSEYFIAACNANRTIHEYLLSGDYRPRPSIQTVANAMDVGDPSNFERLISLFDGDYSRISNSLRSNCYTDEQILEGIRQCHHANGYLLDPHGACGYLALKERLLPGQKGVFLATAHPAKFSEVYVGAGMEEPRHPSLEALRNRKLVNVRIANSTNALRDVLTG